MSRVLGIKEIAFDCQPSATHCWGLEQPHQGHRAHFCFLCVHLSIAGPHRLTALSGSGNDRSVTTLSQYPPALRSHCPWMSSGKFHTNALLPKCISVTVSPKVGGVWPGPSPGWRTGDRPLLLVCRDLGVFRDISGIPATPGQAYSHWLGLVPLLP